MSKTSNTLLAFLSGAAIGAGVGLLYAPDKGEETRERILEGASKAKDKVKDQWDKTSSNFSSSAKKTMAEIEDKLDKTLTSASGKADDIIVSLQKRLDDLREQNQKFHDRNLAKADNESKTNSKKSKAKA